MHSAIVETLEVALLIVKFNVAVLSQPEVFVVTKVYDPLLAYVVPFQL